MHPERNLHGTSWVHCYYRVCRARASHGLHEVWSYVHRRSEFLVLAGLRQHCFLPVMRGLLEAPHTLKRGIGAHRHPAGPLEEASELRLARRGRGVAVV